MSSDGKSLEDSQEAGITLYGNAFSAPYRSCELLAQQDAFKNVDGVNKLTTSFHDGRNFDEDFKKKWPSGSIPAMDHDGFFLTQAPAILGYFCDLDEDADTIQWYPKEDILCARIDEWMMWQHERTRKISTLLVENLYFKKDAPEQQQETKTDEKKPAWKEWLSPKEKAGLIVVLKSLNTKLGEKKYLASDEKPTIADVFLCCQIDQLVIFPRLNKEVKEWFHKDAEDAKNIFAWLDRLQGVGKDEAGKDREETLKGYKKSIEEAKRYADVIEQGKQPTKALEQESKSPENPKKQSSDDQGGDPKGDEPGGD